MRFLYLLYLVLCCDLQAVCQNELFTQTQVEHSLNKPTLVNLFDNEVSQSNRYSDFVTEGFTLNLNIKALENVFNEAPQTMTMALPQQLNVTLELYKADVFSHDFKLKTSDGKEFNFSDEVAFYRGHIKKDPNSIVSMTITRDDVLIMYSNKEGNKRIQKMDDASYLAFEDKNIKEKSSFTCGVKDDTGTTEMPKDEILDGIRYATEECATVFVVCDYESFQDNNHDLRKTYLWVAKLWNEVVTIYQNEQIKLRVSNMFVYTSLASDPFKNLNSTESLLNEFDQHYGTNNNGWFMQLMTTRPVGGGLAHLYFNNNWGGNCTLNSAYYCSLLHSAVSGNLILSPPNFPSYSFSVMVLAHELGHSMGSPHTHACKWNGNATAIDGCSDTENNCPSPPVPPNGGTIMSYCHQQPVGINFSLGFGTQPGDKIRCYLNNLKNRCTLGSCLTEGTRCADAANLPCGSSIPGTTTIASWDNVPACNAQSINGPGAWFTFTGNGQNTIISTCSAYTYNTAINIYRGSCNSLICVTSNDDYCAQGSQVAFPTTIGTVYYVLVQGSGIGNFTITRTCTTGPNVNDLCSGATPLSCGQSLAGNTYWATIDTEVNYCDQLISGPGVWYKFTGNDQNNIISTCPPVNTFFSRISIYKNECGNLLCVTGNDGFCFPGSRVSFFAQSGEEYFVLVHGANNERGDFTIQRTCIPQPLGDVCSNAITLNCGTSLNGNTTNASDDWESVLCGYSNPYITPGIWYTFVGNGQNTTISTCAQSSMITRITAFGGNCHDLECLGQGNGDCSNWGDKITIPTVNGMVYYILIEGIYEQGTFTVSRSCFNPPSGDLCSTAIILPCNDTLSGNTLQASIDPGIPSCGFNSSPGVWYKINGHGETSRVSTCVQHDFNTQLQVYRGSCENLDCVGSNYNFCGEGSQISINTDTDSTYYVLLSGTGEQGTFNISNICYTPVVGDDCHTSINLPVDTTFYGNTAVASIDPYICDNYTPNSAGIWYKFIGDGKINEILVNGYTTLNSKFSVLIGDCGNQECINGAEDYNSYNSFLSFITQVGVEYYILVNGHYSQGVYSIRRTSRLSSDVCISALNINCGDTLTGTTVNTTIDNNLPICNGLSIQSPSVWYKITGNGQMNEISLCSEFNFDTRISVYKNSETNSNSCTGNLICVTSNNNFCGNGSMVSFPTSFGVTYFILVHGTGGATGNFKITRNCITIPGDNCSDALPMICNDTISGTTIGALYDYDLPLCNNQYSGAPGVWYTFTGNNLTNIISTCYSSYYNTQLTVFSGTCGDLVCVASNDDYCNNKSEVTFFAVSGVEYFVLVSGRTTNPIIPFDGQGNFNLIRQCTTPLANDFCAQAIEVTCGQNISGSLLNSLPDYDINDCAISDVINSQPIGVFGVWYKIIGNGNNIFLSFTGVNRKSVFINDCNNLTCFIEDSFTNLLSFTSEVGTVYYIYIFKSSVTPGLTNEFTMSVSCSAPKPNDICVNATNLPCATYISGTTNGAAEDSEHQQFSRTCEKSIDTPGVWYKFTGNGQNMNIYTCITPGTNFFLDLTVFQNDCDSLTCVGDEVYYYYCDNGSLIQITTIPNKEYYILVHGYNTVTGNFWIRRECLAPAPADNCSAAINISCGQSLSGSTLYKPFDNPEIPHCLFGIGYKARGAWYKITGNGQVAKLATCTNNGIHHELHVYRFDCSNLTCLDYRGWGCTTTQGSEIEFMTTIGFDYYIFVESDAYGDPGEYSLTYTCLVPEPGTSCSTAEVLSCGQTIGGNTYDSYYTELNDTLFCGPTIQSRARWYKFIGDGDNTTISTCNSSYNDNTVISVLTGSCDSLTCLVYNDDFCGIESSISFATVVNAEYYILVYSGNGDENIYFEITRSCANDNCLSAFDITCDGSYPGNTTFAAPSVNLPLCDGDAPVTSPGVWYKFTGDGQNTRLSTCSFHNFDTRINVYTGTCQNLICYENNNNFCGFGSQVYLNTITGTEYYVYVHGNGTAEGNFTLERTCDSDTFYCQSAGIHPTVSPVSYFGINDSLVGSDIASYTFYNQDTILISRGGNSEIQIVNFEPGLGFYKIWIDFNRNGDFTDENELVTSFYSTDSLVIDTILIPQNISKGITRLRLIKNLWEWPSSPCEIFNFGEVEDYLVDVRCNLVTTTIDAGSGSLRSVANCVDEGEYVLFAPNLNNQIIELTNGPLNVMGNWRWKADSLSNITISAENISRVLFIPQNTSLELDNLNFIGGTSLNGCVLENRGNLTLINCSLENLNPSNVSTLLNNGILKIYGFCTVD